MDQNEYKKKYYIYAHINAVKNEIFYIGKGFGKRAYAKNGRSKFWKNTVAKYNYIVDILEDGLTEEQAFIREKSYITRIGRRDLGTGPLVNLTDGGEGSSGTIKSDETKKKLSEAGKNRKHSEESKNKMSEAKKGIIFSEKHKQNLSKNAKEKGFIPPSQKGRIKTIETKIKHSNSISGDKNCHAKKIICVETNKIWGSAKECAKYNNINYSTLVNKLNGLRKNNTSFRYL
jgi:hypothetical protein